MTDEGTIYEADEGWEGFSSAKTDLEDESLHPAILTAIELKRLPSKYPDGRGYDASTRTAPAVIWTFALQDREGYEVDGTSSEATGQQSKARKWIESLVGKKATAELLKSGLVPRGQLVGRECNVLVTLNDAGYPKVSTVLPRESANAPRRAEEPAVPPPDTAPVPSDDGLGF